MTKEELIERHGLKWYEEYKTRASARCKERYMIDPEYRKYKIERDIARKKVRYQNDSEFRESVKVLMKTRNKERYQNDSEFRESVKARMRKHYHNDPGYQREYKRNDLNSNGKTKTNIRTQSNYILFKKRHHSQLKDYEIHHCFGYDDPNKFIYIPKTLHNTIHQYLRDSNIDADSCHFDSIKHLINEYTGYTYISI